MSLKRKIKGLINKPEYFLLIGAGRGGTSLLASMLDFHPDLKVGFERFAFDFLLGEALSKDRAALATARLLNFDKACTDEARKNSTYWGNKITTEQIFAIAECEGVNEGDVAEIFVSGVVRKQKVIFIVRDGRHCVNSKMKRAGLSYDEAVKRWKASIGLLNSFLEKEVNMHICRYEDLLESPEEVLAGVCEFLGYQFNDAMMKGTENPMMPNMYEGSKLRPVPPLSEVQQSWTDDMHHELEQLNYIHEY